MTTPFTRTILRKAGIITGLLLFLLFIPSYTGFSWSSTEYTGMFTTHQFLTRMAYTYLEKHPMIQNRLIHFPPLSKIETYCGLNLKLTGGQITIYGEGPDNPAKSSFADHYYNPDFPGGGAGSAPDRIQENYVSLCQDISASSADDNTARCAAYLAHYIQDMTCPFHVLGAPDNDLQFTAEAIGPYMERYGERTGVLKEGIDVNKVCANPVSYLTETNLRFIEQDAPGFWDMMVARYHEDRSKGKNWFEPNYYNGHICPVFHTYLSTHFLYEAMVAHYHNNPELNTRFSHLSNINELTNNWNSLSLMANRPGEFAKKLARLTKEDLDNYDSEFMFDPRELISYTFVGYKALGYADQLSESQKKEVTEMQSTVPLPVKAWTTAIQATYTLWRASFSALYVDCEKDVLLFQAGVHPDTWVARVRVTNYEPGATAKNITVSLKQASGGADQALTKATVAQLANTQSGNSVWVEFKKPFALQGSAPLKIEITGTFDKVPDAGKAAFTKEDPETDPLGGTWHLQEANALVAILYNPELKQYEGRVLYPGDLAFHGAGVLLLTGVKPVDTPMMMAADVPDDKTYTGTECSWEVLTNPDGSYSKGQPTRLPATITVNGKTMTYRTKDDTFHFTRQ
jgi:hypothetical protein